MRTHAVFFKLPRRDVESAYKGSGRGVFPLLAYFAALCVSCAASQPTPPSGPPQPDVTTPTPATAEPPAQGLPHLPPVTGKRPDPPSIQVLARVELEAVGDVLMHGAVKEAAEDHRALAEPDGFSWLWAPIADLLSASDLTFANLETPVAPRAGRGTHSFVFNAPPGVPSALRRAGVKLVSVANNHAFDQGRPGFEETLAELEATGLAYVGAGEPGAESGPRFMEVNGLRLAFLGYAHFFNQDGNACPPARPEKPCLRASLLDPDRAVEDVRRAVPKADAVVVSVHWGEEYQSQPREKDVELAHRLAEAGALVVLGHHPHVLQPIELYPCADGHVALIAYSLGNFISNQSRNYEAGVTPDKVGDTRDGVLLRASIVRRDYGRGVVRVELGAVSWLPLWTENDTADSERRRLGKARPTIQVVSIDRALALVRARLAALPDPLPADRQGEYLRLRRREELYLLRRTAIAEVLGEDLEAEAPPPPPNPASAAGP